MESLFSPIVGEAGVRHNEPMSTHTTFQIGGPADVMVFPQTTSELARVMDVCQREGLATFILGKGSNILVSDAGIRGVVISTEEMKRLLVTDEYVTASAGLSLINVAKATAELGLSGLEFASGIPGSIGGACYMNAGAYDGEMKDVIESVTVLDTSGAVVELSNEEMHFAYRYSLLKDLPFICLDVCMKLHNADKREIMAKIADLTHKRSSRQPLEYPSAGSTFKRPEGHYAGPLIIECGLQGYSVGGAQVSTKHAGFVVNTSSATADDVARLIHHVQQTVLKQKGVRLETEVRFIGEWDSHPIYHDIMKAE